MMKNILLSVLLSVLLLPINTYSCTVVVISGKSTPDGRPILWKHRDTNTLDNKLIHLNSGKYSAIALIDSDDVEPTNIWIGFNSEGFAIMNSASYNLKGNDTTKLSELEGEFMKKALLECANVDEFEQFIINHSKPIGVEANFGVIDAQGGAAYFETDNWGYKKIDVNDSSIAPHGYLVHTNYSFTGDMNDGAGYIRFETAEKLFYRASGTNNLSVPYMLENMCQSLENSYTTQKLSDFSQLSEDKDNFMYFQDCINRYSSSSSVIVQGVKPDEKPLFTTMWSMIGFPMATVPIPVWLTPKGTLPSVSTAPEGQNAKICDMALELKKIMVPSRRGSTKYYINTTKVANMQGTGITQILMPIQKQIVSETNKKLDAWRQKGSINQAEIDQHNQWIDNLVKETYKTRFDLD